MFASLRVGREADGTGGALALASAGSAAALLLSGCWPRESDAHGLQAKTAHLERYLSSPLTL